MVLEVAHGKSEILQCFFICQDISEALREFGLNNLLVLTREGESAVSKNISTTIGIKDEILSLKNYPIGNSWFRRLLVHI